MRGSRNFRQGGPAQFDKKSSDVFFFCFFLFFVLFLVLSLFFRCQMVNLKKKTIIFQGSRGGPTFSRGGGSNFFQGGGGGVQLLIPYRNPYNL